MDLEQLKQKTQRAWEQMQQEDAPELPVIPDGFSDPEEAKGFELKMQYYQLKV